MKTTRQALLKSWHEMAGTDVSRIATADGYACSVGAGVRAIPHSHNYTVSILRRIFAITLEPGAHYNNPAGRRRQRLKRHLKNPLAYLRHHITNGVAEGLNGKIQNFASAARAFRIFQN